MFRVGIGYDIHRLKEGVPLILGGVNLPYHKGLEGHSDADVLVHAIMDAMLGAASLPDIGVFFPDTDKSLKGISSFLLLREVDAKVKEKNFSIINIDSVIIAEEPKIAPFIPEMKSRIAALLKLSDEVVAIKATTHEKLGALGEGKGIAAQAVVLLAQR